MNDEQLIWEAYKKQKVKISPIKEELIELLEGFRHFKRMIHNYLSFYEKKLNVNRRAYSEEGQPITPEEERDARIFQDEYLQNFRDIENISDDYEVRDPSRYATHYFLITYKPLFMLTKIRFVL